MVNKNNLCKTTVLFLMLFSIGSPAAISISQEEVAQKVLREAYKAKEISLKYDLNKLALVNAEGNYDWILQANSSYQKDQTQSFSPSGDIKDETTINGIALKKPFATGTTLGVQYQRLTLNAIYSPLLSSPPPADRTQDLVGFSIDQSIWRNFLGAVDRAQLQNARLSYKASTITLSDDLEKLVLDSIRLYWNTYVAQENFKEATSSRDRYAQLVEVVKKKASLHYANPGELANVQAEYQQKNSNAKVQSSNYLAALDELLTTLQMPPGSDITFKTSSEIPSPPSHKEIEVENLREVRAAKLRIAADDELISAAKSKNWPDLTLTGQYYSSGLESDSSQSFSEMSSQTHPKYYVGVKLIYSFGSNSSTEEIHNRTVTKTIEETSLQRRLLEIRDEENRGYRKVQAAYAVAVGAQETKRLREIAMNELQKSYSQGRTDLQVLIDSMNRYFSSEVDFSRAIGDYQIALNEWAATRNELIPDQKN